MNCHRSFRTKSKLASHKKVCKSRYFCGAIMTSEGTKILEFNHHQKSDKTSSIFYADLESLIKIIDECKGNSETSSKTKKRFLLGVQCLLH